MGRVLIRTRFAGAVRVELRMGSKNTGRTDDPQWVALGLIDTDDTDPYTACEDGQWSCTYDRAVASRFSPEEAAAWILVVEEDVVRDRVFWTEEAA